jgi:hypothetical protein
LTPTACGASLRSPLRLRRSSSASPPFLTSESTRSPSSKQKRNTTTRPFPVHHSPLFARSTTWIDPPGHIPPARLRVYATLDPWPSSTPRTQRPTTKPRRNSVPISLGLSLSLSASQTDRQTRRSDIRNETPASLTRRQTPTLPSGIPSGKTYHSVRSSTRLSTSRRLPPLRHQSTNADTPAPSTQAFPPPSRLRSDVASDILPNPPSVEPSVTVRACESFPSRAKPHSPPRVDPSPLRRHPPSRTANPAPTCPPPRAPRARSVSSSPR